MVELTNAEVEKIHELAERLTGVSQKGKYRKDIFVSNIRRNMALKGVGNLAAYLDVVEQDPTERELLISSLTIHTTSWFREAPHYQLIVQHLRQVDKKHLRQVDKGGKIRILSAACSTGQEPFSIGLEFEAAGAATGQFDYEIEGIDIDPKSVACAQRAIYAAKGMKEIPPKYFPYLLRGTGKTKGLFTLSKRLRDRVRFSVIDIRKVQERFGKNAFDCIVCRNVLIYFDTHQVDMIVATLAGALRPGGILCLGHNEIIDSKKFGLTKQGNSLYVKEAGNEAHIHAVPAKPHVLVIDDSPTVRKAVCTALTTAGIDAVGVDGGQAADAQLKTGKFDAITLDLNMPVESGQEWLARFRARGGTAPVIIVSGAGASEAAPVLGALERGAQDYIDKALLATPDLFVQRLQPFLKKDLDKAGAPFERRTLDFRPKAILIGASTGGTVALCDLLDSLPASAPPIVVVQHINHEFAKAFATRLAGRSGLQLHTDAFPAVLKPGSLYLALNDSHLELTKKGSGLAVGLSAAEKMNRHRPSVDHFFLSAAMARIDHVMAILLTGMGEDGANGLAELRALGAYTMAQDAASCVVFGMPRAAIKKNAVDVVGNLPALRRIIDKAIAYSD